MHFVIWDYDEPRRLECVDRNVGHPIRKRFIVLFFGIFKQTPKTAAAMEYEIADLYQFRQSATGALIKRLATVNKTRGEHIMFVTPCNHTPLLTFE